MKTRRERERDRRERDGKRERENEERKKRKRKEKVKFLYLRDSSWWDPPTDTFGNNSTKLTFNPWWSRRKEGAVPTHRSAAFETAMNQTLGALLKTREKANHSRSISTPNHAV